MSGRKERERRRTERLEAEQVAGSEERRRRLLQFGSAAVFLAIVVVAVLIVRNVTQTDGGDTDLEKVAEVKAELKGIPQRDLVLGDPQAKVTLYEFGDLQCPVCKAFSEEILPDAIQNQVRAGKAKLIFRNYPIIGAQSGPAGAAAIAAGAQGKGWTFIELFYRNQGLEDSGYADGEFLTAIAKAAGVRDIAKWNRERNSSKTVGEVNRSNSEAQALGITGTPTLKINGPNVNGGSEILAAPGSPASLEELIENAG
jgi:protein-disulfide isomerase